MLLAWLVGASVSAGISAAVWVTAGCVLGLEVIAGWRAGVRLPALWLQVAGGVALGVAIIALKHTLH